MRPIRISAKAIIVRDGALLAIAKQDEFGVYYILPGGGAEPWETLPQALRRECREETGAEVEVGPLMLVRDYVSSNHEFRHTEPETHQLELMFRCLLNPGAEPAGGHLPDDGQTHLAWLPLADLLIHRLYPQAIRPLLAALQDYHGPVYVGDVN